MKKIFHLLLKSPKQHLLALQVRMPILNLDLLELKDSYKYYCYSVCPLFLIELYNYCFTVIIVIFILWFLRKTLLGTLAVIVNNIVMSAFSKFKYNFNSLKLKIT